MESRFVAKKDTATTVEFLPGIFRTTLCYDEKSMLCHFVLRQGAQIPLHNHTAVQNGYLIKGKVKFFKEDGSSFIAEPGTGYLFASDEPHGADIIEDAEAVECFSPMRPEYADT